jgi:NTE family protein
VRQAYHDELLYRLLQTSFADLDEAALSDLWPRLEWQEIAGGQTLMHEGEPGDALYLLVSGRLRAYVRGDDAVPRAVGEITRGEIVGEMSLFTGEPRMASVVAIRDSLLVRLGKEAFDGLLLRHVGLARALSSQVIRRLKAPVARAAHPRPITVGILPASTGIDLAGFAAALAQQLARFGRTEVVDAASVQRELDQPDATLGPGAQADVQRRITLLLDRIEARHEFVILLADPDATAWTARCCRDADELLLLADATAEPKLHPIERLCLIPQGHRAEVAEVLLLLHPRDCHTPQGTRAWLDRRPLAGQSRLGTHLHLRQDSASDLARLARFLNRSATGLVLAGGGARGLAHLGVLRALQEQGIEVDAVGGTSIGAVMATYVGSRRPLDEVMANARGALASNPTGDLSAMPWLSVFRGARLRRTLEAAVGALFVRDAESVHLEDLWLPTFFVATNYSQAQEQVLARGPLVRLLLASTAIPGALPPVLHDGDLLCDGGSFNNFPVDVMRAQHGIGPVIGIDLDYRQPLKVDLDELPGGWSLFFDQWRAPRRRRYRLPSLPTYLMTVMVLYSISRSRRSRTLTDLYFNPPLERVGLLQWKRFDRIVQRGYEHGLAVLTERAASTPEVG